MCTPDKATALGAATQSNGDFVPGIEVAGSFIAFAMSFVVLKPSTVGTILTRPPHDRTSVAPTTVSGL